MRKSPFGIALAPHPFPCHALPMRPRVSTILIALLSLAGGGAARWVTLHPAEAAEAADVRKASGGPRTSVHFSSGKSQAGVTASATDARKEARSGIEEILALRGFEQFERFAEWLADADTAELRGFALAMKAADKFDSKLSDALLLRWVELDAADAVQGGRESGCELAAWWAWGKLDPERALAAAAADGATWKGAEALRGIAQTEKPVHILAGLQFLVEWPDLIEGVAPAECCT